MKQPITTLDAPTHYTTRRVTCPRDTSHTLLKVTGGGWFCRDCYETIGEVSATVDERAPYVASETLIQTAKRRNARPEAKLIQEIRKALLLAGFKVYRVGQYRADMAGSDPGVGDFLVSRPGFLCCLAIDAKIPGGEVSPAQAEAVQNGYLHLCETAEEALLLAQEFARRVELNQGLTRRHYLGEMK